jgi:transposase
MRCQSRIRKEPVVAKGITYIGLDAHKKFINVAMLLPRRKKPEEWKVDNEPKALKRLVRKLLREAPGEIRCCYEAGVCGFALQRTLEGLGKGHLICEVIAPSLIPKKPGEKIKTDRRDARKLAELNRAELLTVVHPLSAEDESVRDLCRCREDAQEDLMRARHRLSKWLLRRGFMYSGKNWTRAHKSWLLCLEVEHAADRAVFDDYVRSMEQIEERLKDLLEHIEATAQTEPYVEAVGLLRCFRGIDTLTAMTIVAELHDFGRFESPRALMSYLGLVPGEHSSSGKSKRLGITKTGNKHVRRILIEASKHYRKKPNVGVRLKKRRQDQPGDAIVIADKAQTRLHRRYWRLVMQKNKNANKATVAVARELIGFIWAVLYPRASEVGPGRRKAA